MMITEKTTLGELKNNVLTAPLVPFLLYNRAGDGAGRLKDDAVTLEALQKNDPVWKADSMASGLNAWVENAEKGERLIFSVYSDAACREKPELSDVKLIFFPAADPRREARKTAVLAAGGAYGAVSSLPESFPVAAELSRAGVDVFCLNYRVADGRPLFPRPMEDLHAAVRYLLGNRDTLGIDMTHYAVGGFSAGAHLAACFGTEELGYARDGLPKPELMILAYPLISAWKTTAVMPEPVRTVMRDGYLGRNASEEDCRPYNVDECVSAGYPPTWMIQAADDPVVPVFNTELMEAALKAHSIRYRYERTPSGGHGWGTGVHTPAEGWIPRALDFWNEIQRGEAYETV